MKRWDILNMLAIVVFEEKNIEVKNKRYFDQK